MEDLVDFLPSEPLPLGMAEQLHERDGRFVPVAAFDAPAGRRVCAMLIEGRERLRGVGYDTSDDYWEIVAVRPESGVLEGLPEARRQEARAAIIDELESWTRAHYDQGTLLDFDAMG